MKTLATFLVIVVVLISSTLADTEHCEILGKKIAVGETYNPIGKCNTYKCDGPGQFSAKTCPQELALYPCVLKDGDVTKPYPNCCPKWVCPE